jgi:hypothetical protein
MDKTFLHRILPEYVINNQERFVDFVEHWLDFNADNLSIENILNNFDIDNVNKNELEYIKTMLTGDVELLENTNTSVLPQDRMILKNIKNIFDSKGSAQALSYIFKYYYGEDVIVTYPKDKSLVCSSGHWIKPIIFTVYNACDLSKNLIGQNVRGLTTLSTGLIIAIKKINDVQYVSLSNVDGAFIPDEIIEVIS